MALDLGTAVGYLDLDTDKFQQGLTSAFQELKAFTDQSATTGQKWTALGKTLTTIGGGLTVGLTTPLLGVGAAAVSVGNDFEAQMSRVEAIAGATADEMEALRDQAIQLGADTSFSASEVAEAMENLASAGFGVNEIMAAMPGLLDLAASSGASLGDASAYVATTMNAFGLEAENTAHIADVFAQAAARTNAQTEDMGEAMKYIAPVASAMGLSLEETAASIGVLSDAGIQGSQAGTTLRSMLSSMTRQTGPATEAMKQLGITFYDTNGEMRPLSENIGILQDAMKGLTQEQQNNALVTIFGQEALSGVLALMAAGPEEVDALTASLENSDGAAQSMAETMLDNTKGAIEQMMGAFESAGIVIQAKLAPFISDLALKIGDLATKFSQLDDDTLELIVTIAGVVAAIGPALLVFGNVAKGIGAISTAISGLGGMAGVASAFGATVSGVFTALTGPIGAVIAFIGILFVAWQTDFNGMRDTVANWATTIQAIIQNVLTIIQTIIGTALGLITMVWSTNFANIQGIVTAAFTYIQDNITNVLNIIKSLLDVWVALFTGDWQGFLTAISNLWTSIWTGIRDFVANILNLIIQIIIGVAGGFVDAVMTVLSAAKVAFESGWRAITDWFGQAVNDPVGTVLGIGQALYSAGASIFTSLLNGIQSVWTSIQSFVESAVNWLVDKIAFWEDNASSIGSSTVKVGRSGTSGSYASGLDYVPRDMNVRVHEGEAILTKEENQNRKNNSSTGDTYIFNSPENIDAITAAREFRKVKVQIAEGLI